MFQTWICGLNHTPPLQKKNKQQDYTKPNMEAHKKKMYKDKQDASSRSFTPKVTTYCEGLVDALRQSVVHYAYKVTTLTQAKKKADLRSAS